VATSVINEDNEYGFNINPVDEGLYILGDKRTEVPIYIKGDQSFKINFAATTDIIMENIPDHENEILYNWFKSNDTLEVYNFMKGQKTYEDFFPFYERYIPIMKKQHANVTSNNERFNNLMHTYIDIHIENVALSFIFSPRSKHPKSEDMPPFYEVFMSEVNFKSSMILEIPRGLIGLRQHLLYKYMFSKDKIDMKNSAEYSKKFMGSIENDTLKGYVVLNDVKKYKTYSDTYLDFITPYRKYIALSEYVSKEIDAFEVTIKTMQPGVQGYEFTYKDINGKDVSFSDFKGKYVYIDAWATWCAPCKKEIPYLKQLEKDFHGKNIVFLSISMDKQKDKAKWEAFVKEKKLGGVQLITDNAFDTRIARDYKIKTIPRFLLFDTEGKIIDADAKRPSNPALKQQLKKLLN